VTLTGGNRNDITQLIPLLDAAPPIRGRRGRPRHKPREVYADRGYDHDTYRRILRARGITPRIARRGEAHGSGLGRIRWVVERGFAWLHAVKRWRTRYERRADIHLGLLQLAYSSWPTPAGLLADLLPPATSILKRLLRKSVQNYVEALGSRSVHEQAAGARGEGGRGPRNRCGAAWRHEARPSRA
jgi:transposase